MSIVFTYYDLVHDLQALIDGRLNDETLCLYQGSHTPGQGDNTATFLGIEANFGGYARVPMVFVAAALNSDSIAQTNSQVCNYTTTSLGGLPQTIGGVFALDVDGQVAWSDTMPGGPVTLTAIAQSVGYQATITQGEIIT
jgi:hypothetical protein